MAHLKDTKGTKLVEANAHDQVWSCGLGMSDTKLFDETAWKGSNWLGDILVSIRDS